jgi:hypothetical protein
MIKEMPLRATGSFPRKVFAVYIPVMIMKNAISRAWGKAPYEFSALP